MTQFQRFLFLIGLLLCASILLYGFNTNFKPKKVQKIPSKIVTPQISPTVMPTIGADHWDGYESRDMVIEGKSYHLLLADTPEKQELGLMYVTTLEGYDGMLFTFPTLSVKSFWNKNTLVDLQIYWMNDYEIVGTEILPSIYKTGSIKTITSPGPANTVVELLVSNRL